MTDKTDYSALPLGKSVDYPELYDPSQLQPISRANGRRHLAINLPDMQGSDHWNAYEVSWLDTNGKPQVACAQVVFPASSPNMVESKSFKLYLNSFNQSRFDSAELVCSTLRADLSAVAGAGVTVELLLPEQWHSALLTVPPTGLNLDKFDVSGVASEPEAGLLVSERGSDANLSERATYYSNLFRSRCPVTGQPDWATVEVELTGRQPEPASLLAYLLSYRSNDEFHEQCVERMFADIYQTLRPERLSVYARYTRRGGLDINPLRSTHLDYKPFHRLTRQ
ncbi:MAG TPA: NADPH-dependent 7-cyano-7-deazaguanine reductase QueF [Spongiibacteraceae bacterium]|nr:NADPH-dependent 7-cyano-7-deazaguanine reductase QueF [Spongiibacteraceae bacterium]HCS27049.1 NADPH-dependent 7-cyano-7-deazaguanine reductase QueF [Spongiibacteraceae bacterium]|tara:strand:- start:667 stop:1509 length:843 start_codon:yes stop_codon:yes gene_type:complete